MKPRIVFFLFIPLLSFTQGVSLLPTHLPNYIYGTWVNDENEIILIVSEEYIVIKNRLYLYNDIIKEDDKIDFVCVNNDYNVKYISLKKIGIPNIILDEGFEITNLYKLKIGNTKKISNTITDDWYSQQNKITLKEREVLFDDESYSIDYIVSSNNINFYVIIYNASKYTLLYNYMNDNGHFLNANFEGIIVFEKVSFFKKNKPKVLIFIIIILLFLSYLFIKLKIKQAKKKEINKRLFVEMQLKSIRSQMNPHFLFNALSAIQNLINKGDNEKANHYLAEFSQLMRLTLDKSEKGLVPLHEEIESIKKYLELEKLRFHFNYNIILEEGLNIYQTEIPAMLIQPFIENAIAHGLYETTGSKEINIEFKIEVNNLLCSIIDSGIGFNKSQAKKTIGLKREKYGIKLAKDRINLINESYKTNAKVMITDLSENNSNQTGTKVQIYMPLKLLNSNNF